MRETCWGWGKEQHLYNTYLPMPSSLLSKHSLPGSQPTQAVAGSLLDTDVLPAHVCCGQALGLGAGNKTSCYHCSSSNGSRKDGEKRGVF